MAILLDGKKVAEKILKPVQREVSNLKKKGIDPFLSIILVGREDPQSLVYIREKKKKAKEIGIITRLFKLKKKAKACEVKNLIEKLDQDPKVHGILVQLPLPPHLDPNEILDTIKPKKDVDGLTLNSPHPPACASGILEILSYYQIPIKNKKVVIVGTGRVVGKPLFKLMKKEGAKVILSDRETQKADILVGATPVKDIITKDMVKKGAAVVDAAKNVQKDVRKVASYLTPKIGGVGPVTVAVLLKNLVNAAGGS